ncbi:MAG: hypothetical protein JKY48_00080 [Flavobacteriales bacterium]|nr:hypothetical protein [Flavobacteriales bacterium]
MLIDDGPQTILEGKADATDSSNLVDLPNIDQETVFGIYTYKKLPSINQAIVVLDENGLPIDTIYTDSEGKFKYTKLSPDSKVSFALLNTKDINLDDVALDVMDSNSKLVEQLIYNKRRGYFANIEEINMEMDTSDIDPKLKFKEIDIEDEAIFGHFDYKKLPMSNKALIVMDQDGNIIDTLYTDTHGNFKYPKKGLVKDISIVPMDIDPKNFQKIDLYLTDSKGNKAESMILDPIKSSFSMRQIAATSPKADKQAIGTSIEKDGLTIYNGAGNFVVVAAFRGLQGSKRKLDELMKKGIKPIVTRNNRDTWYLICLSRHDAKESALQEMRKARVRGFDKAWVGIK